MIKWALGVLGVLVCLAVTIWSVDMIKWVLGVVGVLVGLAVTVRIGQKEAARLLNAMAATDGSDEVGANYRDSFKAKTPITIDHDEMPTHDPFAPGVSDPATARRIVGPVSFDSGTAHFDNCYFDLEEPAVRRARLHIAARRDLQ
jgi:hypothetical protein